MAGCKPCPFLTDLIHSNYVLPPTVQYNNWISFFASQIYFWTTCNAPPPPAFVPPPLLLLRRPVYPTYNTSNASHCCCVQFSFTLSLVWSHGLDRPFSLSLSPLRQGPRFARPPLPHRRTARRPPRPRRGPADNHCQCTCHRRGWRGQRRGVSNILVACKSGGVPVTIHGGVVWSYSSHAHIDCLHTRHP